MKRRNFLKGLVALALAPVAALSKEDSSPAKLDKNWKDLSEDEVGHFTKEILLDQYRPVYVSKEAAAIHGLPVGPEVIEDIRNWGVDQIDEQTRREILDAHSNGFVSDQTVLNTTKPNRNGDIFVMNEELFELGRKELRLYTEQGCAIMDNRRVLLAEF
jgi:hypothetical protein